MQRAGLKRQVRDVANGARNFAMGLRRRMNALDAHDVEGRSGPNRQEAEALVAPDGADEPGAESDAAVDPT
jgi:hypothetical protein